MKFSDHDKQWVREEVARLLSKDKAANLAYESKIEKLLRVWGGPGAVVGILLATIGIFIAMLAILFTLNSEANHRLTKSLLKREQIRHLIISVNILSVLINGLS